MSCAVGILVNSFVLREGHHPNDGMEYNVFRGIFGTVVITSFTSINPSYRVLMSNRELL